MADDAEPKPAPRPRRRRTDIDPTIKAPRVPNGRRRSDRVPDVVSPDPSVAATGPSDVADAGAAAGELAAADGLATLESMAEEPSTFDPIVYPPVIADQPVSAGEPAPDEPTTRFLTPGAVGATARITTATSAPEHGSWLPMVEDRSPDPNVCPFLRTVGAGSELVAPIEAPDPANRCAALREAVPQSLRQQELVCLASGHVNCPRYLRGALGVTLTPAPVVRAGRTITPAVLGSLVVLVIVFTASIAFVLARGGMELTAAAPTRSPVASGTALAVAPSPTAVAVPTPSAAPTVAPTPSLAPTPSPTAIPTATPAPTPAPTPTPQAEPTSDRYALLRPCPGTPDCWIYRVRAGDNVYSIARYFGVSEDSIYDRNPWVRNGLRPGQDLRLPPPTR